MPTPRDFRPTAYVIVLLGCALALAAALVPFYGAAYHLDVAVLLALLTPFVLYAMFTVSLRGFWLLGSGLGLLGVCFVVVAFERYLDFDGYADGIVYWAPLLGSVIVLPIAYVLGRCSGD